MMGNTLLSFRTAIGIPNCCLPLPRTGPAKPMAMDGDPQNLPEEIIINILIQLPVKSLIRFQCVCKHWRNLFKTSSFIADHLRHSHQKSFLLFECYGYCDPFAECVPLHLSLVDRQIQVREVQNAPWINNVGVVRIVDSSNGLLCVRIIGTNHALLLCNIAIRDIRTVPKPRDLLREEFHVGFGFSPVVNDYRIVRLCASFFDDLVYGVEVFSVSTGSWKGVEVGNLEGVTLMKSDGFTIDGSIFWFGLKPDVVEAGEGEHVRHLIVSFDIATEVFTLIPMPPIHFNLDTKFTISENKLAVLCPIEISESCLIELWVMEDSSASGERKSWSWTKKYTSNPYPSLLYPMTVWRNEIVCMVDATNRSIWETEGDLEFVEIKTLLINLTTDEFNTFVHSRRSVGHCIFNHVESLLKVNNVPNEEP